VNGCETHVSGDSEVEKVYMIIQRIFDTAEMESELGTM
jgi:hypothetical protein